ncbi:hypothetical protein EDD86DRAFT_248056 [Gorgonomyces haynaldii]|nr:hypothetical protein EDD86DRAFT_248056 [Gorgonomyces haynaldii]
MEESEYLNPNAFLQFPLKDVDDQPWVSLSPVSENSSPMNSYSATLSPVESNLIFCDHVNLDAFEPNESLLPEPGETLKTEEEIVVFDPIESEPMDGSTVIQDEDEEELYPEQERNPLEYTRNENGELEIPIRLSRRPTVYEIFGRNRIDWCRYVFDKHGCDYKGYGYIEKEPRLNLAPFIGESVKERIRPILQDWCAKCFQHHSIEHNVLRKDTPKTSAIEVPKRNLPLMKSAAQIITPDWTKLEKTSHPRVKRQCTQKRGSPALLKEVKPASEEYEDIHAHFEQMEQRR